MLCYHGSICLYTTFSYPQDFCSGPNNDGPDGTVNTILQSFIHVDSLIFKAFEYFQSVSIAYIMPRDIRMLPLTAYHKTFFRIAQLKIQLKDFTNTKTTFRQVSVLLKRFLLTLRRSVWTKSVNSVVHLLGRLLKVLGL